MNRKSTTALLSLITLAAVMYTSESKSQTVKDATDSKSAQSDVSGGTVVTVTKERPTVVDKIDRRVFSVKDDPEAQTGVMADTLARIPSVTVSPNGTVALRGDTRVTILIDGKVPPNGNAAVKTLAAADCDRVEVMTNPSAAFGPDGSAGIINIILKSRRPSGLSGTLNAKETTLAQATLAGSLDYHVGRWTLDGRASITENPTKTGQVSTIRSYPDPALDLSSLQQKYHTSQINLEAAYKIAESQTLTIRAQAYAGSSAKSFQENVNGADSYQQTGTARANDSQEDIEGLYEYASTDGKRTFSLDLDHTWIKNLGHAAYQTTDSVANNPDGIFETELIIHQPGDIVKGDFVQNFDAATQLSSGFEWDSYSSSFFNAYNFQNIAPDARNNTFFARRQLSAVYITFQKTVGNWTILPGARIEAENATSQWGAGQADTNAVRLLPSFQVVSRVVV